MCTPTDDRPLFFQCLDCGFLEEVLPTNQDDTTPQKCPICDVLMEEISEEDFVNFSK